MDYQKLANELIKALRQSTDAQLSLLGTQRRNTFEDINNRANKRGTLYSTGGAAQRSRYDATEYLPKQAQVRGNSFQQELKIKSDMVQTKQKIEAMNRAAAELNKIDDAYFESLLV